jgi:hypothetical protein
MMTMVPGTLEEPPEEGEIIMARIYSTPVKER